MADRNGQKYLAAWVPADLAARFKALARGSEGGASAALRRLVSEATDAAAPSPPSDVSGHQVMERPKEAERLGLLRAAKARSTTPASWLRSLAIVHLGGRPQWNEAELEALREAGQELCRIGNNLSQIARALNVAAHTREYPPQQGEAAKDAAEMIRAALLRLLAIYSGNFDSRESPDAERSAAALGLNRIERE